MPTAPASRACDLCSGRAIAVRYDFGAHRILRCSDCTFMWLDPQPAAEELHEVYGKGCHRDERFFEGVGETIYGYRDYPPNAS